MQSTDPNFPTMTQLATFSIWLVCATVGIVGITCGIRPNVADSAATVPLKQLTIDVSTDVPSPSEADPTPLAPTEHADAQPALPPAPPAVATPSPDIAFAVPTPSLTRLVAPAAAVPIAPAVVHTAVDPRPKAVPAAIHHLVLGQGEAQFIKLDYPEEAQLNGEEGSVSVQFSQDTDGHVTEAHVVNGCRWPILNEAALKAVRQTPFPPGQPGKYDIPFEFKLQ